jgi:hypothetical protein
MAMQADNQGWVGGWVPARQPHEGCRHGVCLMRDGMAVVLDSFSTVTSARTA